MEFPSVITRTFLLLGICLAILSVAPVKCFVWRTKQATPEGTIVLNYKNMKVREIQRVRWSDILLFF